MSDILDRIKAENGRWERGITLEDGWTDAEVGVFIGWYRMNVSCLERGQLYTAAFLETTTHSPDELDELWARAMLEGGDGGT